MMNERATTIVVGLRATANLLKDTDMPAVAQLQEEAAKLIEELCESESRLLALRHTHAWI